MKYKTYTPQPIDTSDIQLPEELELLVEEMSKNVHDVWAETRIAQGFVLEKMIPNLTMCERNTKKHCKNWTATPFFIKHLTLV